MALELSSPLIQKSSSLQVMHCPCHQVILNLFVNSVLVVVLEAGEDSGFEGCLVVLAHHLYQVPFLLANQNPFFEVHKGLFGQPLPPLLSRSGTFSLIFFLSAHVVSESAKAVVD
jgi:hypothetical protein